MSYRVFLRSFQSLVRRALNASGLPQDVQQWVWAATLHWLRHTHAVRFVEAGGAIDILQENLGHADAKTTAVYYQGELSRRAAAVEAAFGN
ncbi:tyrosine-type recombinase/integrase [Polaromonas sp. JS666]|uniref:tyrosine-type recombinase/integrase n=1 Tax=Polaromonas sp. (strain JS666 / ATCC BAA-500) TaxID=296591 RepID=UPI00350FE095